MTGTARVGVDYTLDAPEGQIVISPGQASATVPLHTLFDTNNRKAKTVKLKLSGGSGYKLPRTAGRSATIKIVNASR
jgi:hypothetical protein